MLRPLSSKAEPRSDSFRSRSWRLSCTSASAGLNGGGAKESSLIVRLSCKPALAALVALHVAEALAVTAAHAEVELFHVLVVAQALRRAVHHHAAVLEDVAIVGIAQRHVGVLLGEQEGHALLAVQVAHDLEHLF